MYETLWVSEWAGPVIRSEYNGKPCFIGTLNWVGVDFDAIPDGLWAAAIKRELTPAALAAAGRNPTRCRTQGIVMDPPRRDSVDAIVVGGPRPGRGSGHKRFTPAELPTVRNWSF